MPQRALDDILDEVKAEFPAKLGADSWYLVAASALLTCSDPKDFGHLYVHLVEQPERLSAAGRQALNKRLREFLMKQWLTIGLPKVTVALYALTEVERPGDADLTFTKSHLGLNAANHEKGTKFLHWLYDDEQIATMFTAFGADFEWLGKQVAYGMFFADDSVLDNLETELITYTAITCQALTLPIQRHLKALQSMGLSMTEIEQVTAGAKKIALWAGSETKGWPDIQMLL